MLIGTNLSLNLTYGGLSAAAIASHIHGPADASQSTNVLVNLAPFNGGAFGTQGAFSGSVTLTPQHREWVLTGQAYLNLHTPANPGGELRGQIAPVLMRTHLSGANEYPTPAATPASGSGTFALAWDQLDLNVTYHDLLSTATASHVHGPASLFESAGALVDLAPFNGGVYGASGSLAGTASLNASILSTLVDGLTYLNFHTTNRAGG